MKFTRLFIFLFFIAITSKAWGQGSTPLVYIYCDYLTSQAPVIEDSAKGWADLIRHFERRELITQKSTISENPKFQECVRNNSQLFETGEFIFEGKNHLRESLGVLKEKAPAGPTLVTSDFAFEDKSITGEYFSVALESRNGAWTPANMESDMRAREERYSALWRDFLDSVRESMPLSKPSISLK